MPGEAGAGPRSVDAAPAPTAVAERALAIDAGPRISPAWQAAFLFLGIAAVLYVVGGLSLAHLPYSGTDLRALPFPGRPWLGAWVHWDSGWYADIADRGYWMFSTKVQSPVAFFPTYPILM